MSQSTENRRKNMILGALVADAAAMGLHWIYDQDHIRNVAPEAPEFMSPAAQNYDGVPAYFAHPGRQSGDQSQYGEQLIVMLQALAKTDGVFDLPTYIAAFRAHFGYGGAYVGYIDHATRGSLDNYRRAEEDAAALGQSIPFDGDPKVTTAMVTKALALNSRYSGETLRHKFEEAVRITHEDDAVVAHGFKVLDAITSMAPARGVVDVQLPAIAKLPALIPALWDQKISGDSFDTAIDDAIRATSDHAEARAYGRVCAHMMAAALYSDDIGAIIEAGRKVAPPEVRNRLDQALAMTDQDTNAATKHFGMACDLSYGVPSVLHNITAAASFRDAIRNNIYAGGDTCGRAMLLGALLGAVYGVGGTQGIPPEWIQKLTAKDLTAYLS